MIKEALGQTHINIDLTNYVRVVVEPKHSPEEMAAIPEARVGAAHGELDRQRFTRDVLFWVARIGRHLNGVGCGDNWRKHSLNWNELGVLQLTHEGRVLAAFGFEYIAPEVKVRSAFLSLKLEKVMGEYYVEEYIASETAQIRKHCAPFVDEVMHQFADIVLRACRWQAWVQYDPTTAMTCVEKLGGYTTIGFDAFKALAIDQVEGYLQDLIGRPKEGLDLSTTLRDDVLLSMAK